MLDGEEIDPAIKWSEKRYYSAEIGEFVVDREYFFTMYSDPNNPDTDGDGFGDSQDPNAKTYDLSIDSETATAIVNFMYDYLGLVMPPVYNNAGEKITAKNKECEETKAYFDEYLWPYLKDVEWSKYDYNPSYEYLADQQNYGAYIEWLRQTYGTYGIESFWVRTSDLTSALYYEISNIEDTFESAKEQIILGNYSDEITITGTAGQIVVGFSGIDFVADMRDVTYDATHWEWSWSHVSQTALDSVGLIPVIGVIKNADKLKNVDELTDAVKSLDKFSGSLVLTDEVKAQITSLIKNADDVTRLKIMESPEIWAKLATQVGQNDDIVVLGKFNVSPNYLEVAKEFKATHYNNEFWDELNELLADEEEMWKINEAFLKQQTAAKKTIIFSQDPSIAKIGDEWDSTSFGRELEFLENNSYTIVYDKSLYGYCYAIPNN